MCRQSWKTSVLMMSGSIAGTRALPAEQPCEDNGHENAVQTLEGGLSPGYCFSYREDTVGGWSVACVYVEARV